jgi:hypothetical protein
MRHVLVAILALVLVREAGADHPRIFAGEVAPQLGLAVASHEAFHEGRGGATRTHPIFALGLGVGWYLTERVACLMRVRGSLPYSFEQNEARGWTWFAGPAIRADVGTNGAVQVAVGYSSMFYQPHGSSADARGIGLLLRAELVRGKLALGLESQPMLTGVSSNALRIIDIALTAGLRY